MTPVLSYAPARRRAAHGALAFYERAQPLVEQLSTLATEWHDVAATEFDEVIYSDGEDRQVAEAQLAAAEAFDNEMIALEFLTDRLADYARTQAQAGSAT